MAFHAEIIGIGGTFKVLNMKYGFEQNINEHQRTSSKPEGGVISLVVEAQQGDGAILAWMISNTMKKSGTIMIARDAMKTSFKTITFSGAYCVAYKEAFDHEDEENLRISFTITCEQVVVNGVTHKNVWK